MSIRVAQELIEDKILSPFAQKYPIGRART